MVDPGELVRTYHEQAAAAATEAQANAEEWRKAQADQLEAEGWTDLAARARTQLADYEAPTEVSTEVSTEASTDYADWTKEDLKAEIQNRNISGMSQANKDELIAALEADDRGELSEEG